MAKTLKTTDTELLHRNGQTVEVVRTITKPDEKHDAEVLPMVVVRFEDGTEAELWPDELVES